jgi:hypothetical protein
MDVSVPPLPAIAQQIAEAREPFRGEDLLRELCDARMATQLLGLLHELDARPRAVAEWGGLPTGSLL